MKEFNTKGFVKGQTIELEEDIPIRGKVKIILIQEEDNIDKNIILDFLKQKLSEWKNQHFVEKIGLFGSFARGEEQAYSDIDLLIKFKETAHNLYEVKNQIRESVENKFNKKVDIANEKFLKPFAREQILKEIIYVTER